MVYQKNVIIWYSATDTYREILHNWWSTNATLWSEAHVLALNSVTHSSRLEEADLPQRLGCWCFTDGSWKDKEIYSEQGWYSTLEGCEELMGARNTRLSLSPLHAEIEAFIRVMESKRKLKQFH